MTGQPASAIPAVPAHPLTVKRPVCGAENNPKSTDCDRCKLPIGNIEAMKAIQQKVVATQSRYRTDILVGEMVQVLGDDEFICDMAHAEKGSKFYIVTERRLISFKKTGGTNAKFALDKSVDFPDIISYTNLETLLGGLVWSKVAFTVCTNDGDLEFWFANVDFANRNESSAGIEFYYNLRDAYQAHMVGTSVAGVLLMRAKL